ncbi:fibronectin type III domain-containing protein, partial [uncultured Eubacterium sp.]|uniref:fibronectin type III domain-containing protein n=1 Tax=uncultured Eubacterium sp. TaxID=165185 RepID=UPI00267330F7
RRMADLRTCDIIIKSHIQRIGTRSSPPTLIKIGDATVSSIANAIYSGRTITPDVTVKMGNITLVKNRDYTLKYSDNIECGTAVVTVVGAGRYDGIQKVCFKIVPEALKGFKVQSQTTKSISIRWKKSNNADGYHLYQYKNGKYVIIKTLKPYHTSFQVPKLRPGTAYKFKICSYKRIDGKIYEGKVSTLSAMTKVSAVNLKVKTKGKIKKLSWKKVRGAKGYEIYVALKKKGKYKKIASNNKTGYDYVIKKGGKFYIRVRAYSGSGSKKIYGAYSKVFKVAAK